MGDGLSHFTDDRALVRRPNDGGHFLVFFFAEAVERSNARTVDFFFFLFFLSLVDSESVFWEWRASLDATVRTAGRPGRRINVARKVAGGLAGGFVNEMEGGIRLLQNEEIAHLRGFIPT
jgi:hypothetical protein